MREPHIDEINMKNLYVASLTQMSFTLIATLYENGFRAVCKTHHVHLITHAVHYSASLRDRRNQTVQLRVK